METIKYTELKKKRNEARFFKLNKAEIIFVTLL